MVSVEATFRSRLLCGFVDSCRWAFSQSEVMHGVVSPLSHHASSCYFLCERGNYLFWLQLCGALCEVQGFSLFVDLAMRMYHHLTGRRPGFVTIIIWRRRTAIISTRR